jgi:hypothetical protein
MGVRRHKAGKRTKKGSIKRRFADLSRETWEVIRMIRGGAAVWIFSVDGAAHDLFFFLFFFSVCCFHVASSSFSPCPCHCHFYTCSCCHNFFDFVLSSSRLSGLVSLRLLRLRLLGSSC